VRISLIKERDSHAPKNLRALDFAIASRQSMVITCVCVRGANGQKHQFCTRSQRVMFRDALAMHAFGLLPKHCWSKRAGGVSTTWCKESEGMYILQRRAAKIHSIKRQHAPKEATRGAAFYTRTHTERERVSVRQSEKMTLLSCEHHVMLSSCALGGGAQRQNPSASPPNHHLLCSSKPSLIQAR
jgi:hypothetical protein